MLNIRTLVGSGCIKYVSHGAIEGVRTRGTVSKIQHGNRGIRTRSTAVDRNAHVGLTAAMLIRVSCSSVSLCSVVQCRLALQLVFPLHTVVR